VHSCDPYPEGTNHFIEIDCPPGATRPWELIASVVEGTKAKIQPEHLEPGAFFGYRRFDFPGLTCQQWDQIAKKTKPRLESLYHHGTARNVSW